MADVRASQALVLAAGAFPALEVRASQALVNAGLDANGGFIRASQAVVLVAAIGRVADPKVRAWTFSLDGHDFYVLRLGTEETLVYDTHSGQWSKWTSAGDGPWWPADGINWLGATSFANSMGSNIVAGDDTYGLLWFLDPRQGYDEGPVTAEPNYYRRLATGQVVHRRSSAIPCYEVFLTANLGDPALTGQEVELFVSDDAGHNYLSVGAITIEEDNYDQRVSWIGLGQITAPGRLFRLEDFGAVERVDSLDMTNNLEEPGNG